MKYSNSIPLLKVVILQNQYFFTYQQVFLDFFVISFQYIRTPQLYLNIFIFHTITKYVQNKNQL